MKAHVYVTLKRTVLDAQGQTIADALHRMQYRGVSDVRQGKYFLLTLDAVQLAGSGSPEAAEEAARAEVDRIAREVLVNPVIEEYNFRLER
jgi:phosphoribosylformylglycinamidine synthase PurS subunit